MALGKNDEDVRSQRRMVRARESDEKEEYQLMTDEVC